MLVYPSGSTGRKGGLQKRSNKTETGRIFPSLISGRLWSTTHPKRASPSNGIIPNTDFISIWALAWDKTNKKFSTDANTDVNGRKITIGAQLSKALKDVPIHFMLAEDENNRKAANWGEDLPGTWKWKDVDKGVKA